MSGSSSRSPKSTLGESDYQSPIAATRNIFDEAVGTFSTPLNGDSLALETVPDPSCGTDSPAYTAPGSAPAVPGPSGPSAPVGGKLSHRKWLTGVQAFWSVLMVVIAIIGFVFLFISHSLSVGQKVSIFLISLLLLALILYAINLRYPYRLKTRAVTKATADE